MTLKPSRAAGRDHFQVDRTEQPDPWLLNYVCSVNSLHTRRPQDGFTCCEIGSGEGRDLVFLAAANPKGHFFGIETNEELYASASQFLSGSDPGNCVFYQHPPAELGRLNIPQLDFLLLKGTLSPDDTTSYSSVMSFAAQHLKPGGVVLCSYRTPHAWAFWEPMIHFLKVTADAPGNRGEQIQFGLRELHRLRDAGAGLFQVSPLMEIILESIADFDPRTFDINFLRRPSTALHFDEVCRTMENIGLAYAGGFPLAFNYPQIWLPANLKDRLASFHSLKLRETWLDLVRMPFFRQDIFTSRATVHNPVLPREIILGSLLQRGYFQFAFDIPGAPSVHLDGPLFQLLADLLAENAMPLAEIISWPALKDFPEVEILSGLSWMTAMGQIHPFASRIVDDGSGNLFRLSSFNSAVLDIQLSGHEGDVVLSSWTLGSSIALSRKRALALLALSEAGPEEAEDWAGRWLVNHTLAGDHDPDESSLGEIIGHARANPRSLAALGLSEKDSQN